MPPEMIPVALKVAGMGEMQTMALTAATRNHARNPPITHRSPLQSEDWRSDTSGGVPDREKSDAKADSAGWYSEAARVSARSSYRILLSGDVSG